ncbi:hypothetical protein J6590_012009 [Homalodisca vitripennis]|nr:hypothetical protein J6590_012009 [Homalodisca vitripennis]
MRDQLLRTPRTSGRHDVRSEDEKTALNSKLKKTYSKCRPVPPCVLALPWRTPGSPSPHKVDNLKFKLLNGDLYGIVIVCNLIDLICRGQSMSSAAESRYDDRYPATRHCALCSRCSQRAPTSSDTESSVYFEFYKSPINGKRGENRRRNK